MDLALVVLIALAVAVHIVLDPADTLALVFEAGAVVIGHSHPAVILAIIFSGRIYERFEVVRGAVEIDQIRFHVVAGIIRSHIHTEAHDQCVWT